MKSKCDEFQQANILRSLTLAGEAVQEPNVTVDDLCDYLDALCDVVNKKSDFNTFATTTNLTGHIRLN